MHHPARFPPASCFLRRLASHSRAAFTLVELLVVIAIIGVLLALLLPAVQAAREAARRSQCTNNLKQMGVACQNYHDVFRHFPAGYLATVAYNNADHDTTPGWSWAALLLPYVEQQNLHARINFSLPVENPVNAAAVQTMLPIFLCPSDQTPDAAFAVPDATGKPVVLAAPSSYACCTGPDVSAADGPTGLGVMFRNSGIRMGDIIDGTSTTIVIGERAWANTNGIWPGAVNGGVVLRGQGNQNPGNVATTATAAILVQAHAHLINAIQELDGALDDFSSEHVGGAYFAFADGSVRFIHTIPYDFATGYTADGLMLQAMGTRANGEVIQGLESN
ncbi:MAG TPA: DUF1559 domain-containing protein [Pirellulales bacterium]|nr:DUF1559 domain-containing protein [Pirellulales bacterium]